MKLILSIFCVFLYSQTLWAGHQNLDQLLQDVKQRQATERKINKAREAEFLAEKQTQQQLLTAAKTELEKQERLSVQLNEHLETNEELLAKFSVQLKERSGELGELFSVAKQAAGDLSADLRNSLISAQYPNRTEPLNTLVESKALPTISQLENLWFTLQQEMTESGKVVTFNREIQLTDGTRQKADITRVGNFNTLANNQYLRFSPDTNILVSLARQPAAKYLDTLAPFTSNTTAMAPLAIDPTRGVMLSMLIQSPNAEERIHQGGIVGYIILVLGAIGFLYAIIRLIMLILIGAKMRKQMNETSANENNPLGRVLLATEQSSAQDVDTLELVLDEAITREVPKLEQGLSMLKLLAAVAPLLGLLGTVTGMIATFQSISLSGTGDPKLMADGISQALVTTMLGLCVAIPLLFLHNLVSSRSKTLVQILDEQSAGIMSRRAGK
ncbi:MAG: hypothetical protein GQ582_13265 [Methyloprofundus sp.]|nr:hypothetical protein [Methyloprofundus sp.]